MDLFAIIERFGLPTGAVMAFLFIFYRYVNSTLDDRSRIAKGYDNSQHEVVELRKANDKLRGELTEAKVALATEMGLRTLLEHQKQDAVDNYLDDTQGLGEQISSLIAENEQLKEERADLEERLNDCGNTIIILQNLMKQRGFDAKSNLKSGDASESSKEFGSDSNES